MSTDQAFDPSLLEGKDRNELVAIATSLGKKPPTRAKKADIIALISELVGGSAAAADGDGRAPGAEPDTAPAPAETDTAAAPADDATPAGPEGGSGAPGGSQRGGQPGGDDSAEGAGDRARSGGQQGNAQQRGGEQQSQQSQQGQRGQQGGGDRQKGDRQQAQKGQRSGDQQQSQQGKQSGDQQQAQKSQQSGDQSNGGQQQSQQGRGNRQQGGDGGSNDAEDGNRADPQAPQADDGDGNRRRRRRGRDRNRNQEDEVQAEPVDVAGVVDLRDEGYGFLRVAGYRPSPDDAYISVKQVRQFGLRRGDALTGRSRAANRNERNPALIQIDTVNETPVASLPPTRPEFEDLTPLFPDSILRLEQTEFPENVTGRIIDLLAPIGKGQRGLIVAPPKAGKTTVLKQVVRSIERNHPEVHVIVLLVDERPEEVTDLRRWMLSGEVAASTFDRPTEEHIALAELVIERAKRMVELGRDVVLVLDGITRLARAYNLEAPANGRTMAGGMDSTAIYPPKRFFGAARNIEEGGSLTILATALVETNTRLDEVIFEEFKGTGNMELRLDRSLAERRIYPAIDVDGSSTRHEELLHDRKNLDRIHRLRRLLSDLKAENGSGAAGMEMLIERMRTLRTNAELLDELKAP